MNLLSATIKKMVDCPLEFIFTAEGNQQGLTELSIREFAPYQFQLMGLTNVLQIGCGMEIGMNQL